MSLSTYFYDPFFDNSGFFSEFDRMFDAAFEARTGSSSLARNKASSTSGSLRPRMDLHESKENNELTATFELPGMKKEDVTIDVHNSRLIISGQSSLSTEAEKDGYAIREREYGKFFRSLPLPAGIKPEEIKASMEDGVLTVKFPKTTPEQEPKKITIS